MFCLSVYSYVSLAKELLALPDVEFLLSGKFDQDPQEEHFSKIRGAGGSRSNPTVAQYGDAALKLQIAGACVRGSVKGNCERQLPDEVDDSLPRPRKQARREL